MADEKRTKTVSKKFYDASTQQRFEVIMKAFRNRRTELAVKIVAHPWIDEKVYSECDRYKLELRVLNSLLQIEDWEIDIQEEITDDTYMNDEDLDIWNVDDLFQTQE